jgi:hypothetical protein
VAGVSGGDGDRELDLLFFARAASAGILSTQYADVGFGELGGFSGVCCGLWVDLGGRAAVTGTPQSSRVAAPFWEEKGAAPGKAIVRSAIEVALTEFEGRGGPPGKLSDSRGCARRLFGAWAALRSQE